MRRLLIEDDAMPGAALRAGMRQDGHAVDGGRTTNDADAAWRIAAGPTGLGTKAGLPMHRTR